MSDHYALHCILSCSHPHNYNKLVYYRQLHNINNATFNTDLGDISLDFNEIDVNKVVEQYNHELLCILNKHALEKCEKFAERDMREWMTKEVHSIYLFIYLFYLHHTHNNGIHLHKLYKQ